jgi:hypothetical protein
MRVVVATLLLGVAAAPAQAFDLTGHWTGKWSCKDFDGGKFSEGVKTSTMDVTQVGGVFAIAIDANTDDFTFNGVAVPDLIKPNEKGEVSFLSCHNTPVLSASGPGVELIRASVKVKADGKASFTGTSIFGNNSPTVGTCKYSYKRTAANTADPGLAACP